MQFYARGNTNRALEQSESRVFYAPTDHSWHELLLQ